MKKRESTEAQGATRRREGGGRSGSMEENERRERGRAKDERQRASFGTGPSSSMLTTRVFHACVPCTGKAERRRYLARCSLEELAGKTVGNLIFQVDSV